MWSSGGRKTTLLNHLFGFDDVTSGTVKIEGVPLESMSALSNVILLTVGG